MVIKNHVFELQNIELEINLQIQEKIISDLKNIIVAQKKTITDNGIETLKLDDQFLDNEEVELEIEDDGELNDDEPFPDDEEEEFENFKNLVAENKEKLRMNQHFDQKGDGRPSKRDKSAGRVMVDKRENVNEKLKSFERESDEEDDERQSDRKVSYPLTAEGKERNFTAAALPKQYGGCGPASSETFDEQEGPSTTVQTGKGARTHFGKGQRHTGLEPERRTY
jgi:uncharacterized coiled-coil protein SlyX